MSSTLEAPLDTSTIRRAFPALSRRINDKQVVFLDGPGGSQVPAVVIDAISTYLEHSNANLDGAFATSRATDALYAEARAAAADLTGFDPDEIAFGANMTTLNFLLAHAVARTLRAGDEIIVTALDHDANVAPWLRIADDYGLTVHTAPLAADATLDTDTLISLISERTRLVAFTLASNASGSVTEATRIARAAHEVGALAWADGVHFAPHRRIDRSSLGVDVLLCSPYKYFGPHLGLAGIRRDLAQRWPADRVRPASEEPAGHRFETGTQSHEALAGFVAAVDYVAGLGAGSSRPERLDTAYQRIRRHEEELAAQFLKRLAQLGGVHLYGIADPVRSGERTPTFAFTVDGIAPRRVSELLAAEGFFVWDGNYYALNLTRALGLEPDGAVRAGFLHYTTSDEVTRFADALSAVAEQAGGS